MARKAQIDETRRAAIKALYEDRADLSLSAIARLSGVSRRSVSRLARRYGWQRAETACDGSPPNEGQRDQAAPAAVVNDPQAMLADLRLQVQRHVADLSAQSDRGQTAQSLMHSLKLVEKLEELDAAIGAANAVVDEGPADIDEFRAEVTRRLEGLLEARAGSECRSGNP